LAKIIEVEAWDGAWYRRAYFDDGTPLGFQRKSRSPHRSLPQTWAAISGAGDPNRVEVDAAITGGKPRA